MHIGQAESVHTYVSRLQGVGAYFCSMYTLITGATSGIGEACARLFASHGRHLVLWARRAERLETLQAQLANQYEIRVITAVVDVRNATAVSAAAQSLPPIDVLINNAGLSRGLEPIQEGVLSKWDEMIDTNIKGLLYVSRAVLPGMVDRAQGTIVNIASIAGRQAYRGGNVYSATKSAAKMLSDSMQIDLNGTGVRVCNVDPGLVETEFSNVRFDGDAERAEAVYAGMTPLTGADVADVVYYAATRPPHVSIQDVLITPTHQATATVVYRT
jgi:3-hydroxy acid dehydrogenase/malonic semialdehyde reductase